MQAVATKFQRQYLAPAVSSTYESLHRYLGRASRFEDDAIPIHQLRQILRQYQLGAATFVNINHLVKSISNQMEAQPAWFNQIVRAAFHLVRKNFFAIISQSHPHALAQPLHLS